MRPGQLRNRLEDYHERDIAEALELLRRDERCRLYALLDAPTLAGVLEYTEDDMPTYLEELGIRKKLEILPLLDPSTAADYLKGSNARSARARRPHGRRCQARPCRF